MKTQHVTVALMGCSVYTLIRGLSLCSSWEQLRLVQHPVVKFGITILDWS